MVMEKNTIKIKLKKKLSRITRQWNQSVKQQTKMTLPFSLAGRMSETENSVLITSVKKAEK